MASLPKLSSDVILAPMAGVTDVAFRLLCKKYGAALTCTEMISANALARENKATIKMINVVPEEKPRVIQLFGQNTESIVQAAKFCEDKCEILDFNLGCPAAKIVRHGSGSALLERPNKIKEIISALSKAVNIPVTVKLRLGIRKSSINVIKIAKICEDSGARMITVHARTQKQGYTGKADWSWIKKVKENVSVPIAGNGDVSSVEDYIRMKKKTGCDYVMVGRGAIGNPYLFKQIQEYNQTGKYSERTRQIKEFNEYLELARKYDIEFNNIKFQAQAFTKGMNRSKQLRLSLSKCKTVHEIMMHLSQFEQK